VKSPPPRRSTAVGASAPVNLGRTEKVRLIEMIDRWAADIGTEQLPVAAWDSWCALVDDFAAKGRVTVLNGHYAVRASHALATAVTDSLRTDVKPPA
jgi:hypothetical protein